jgi:DNA-binding CsgD family transcriptional regulator
MFFSLSFLWRIKQNCAQLFSKLGFPDGKKFGPTLIKWLWKRVFSDHSQNQNKVALWMLTVSLSLTIPVSRETEAVVRERGMGMKEQTVRLGPREQQIVELLLQGCDNAEIASQLKMARRTVKAHFNRLFLRFGISGGIKRVKLATLLYRRQTCQQLNVMEAASPVSANSGSSNWSQKA